MFMSVKSKFTTIAQQDISHLNDLLSQGKDKEALDFCAARQTRYQRVARRASFRADILRIDRATASITQDECAKAEIKHRQNRMQSNMATVREAGSMFHYFLRHHTDMVKNAPR